MGLGLGALFIVFVLWFIVEVYDIVTGQQPQRKEKIEGKVVVGGSGAPDAFIDTMVWMNGNDL